MKVLTDFHLINKISRAFYAYDFFIYKHSQQWWPIYIVEIVFINNLGKKVLMVNSGESGSFRFFSCLVRSFRTGSFRPDFWGESFRPSWGRSFRPYFIGGSFRPDFGVSLIYYTGKTGKIIRLNSP